MSEEEYLYYSSSIQYLGKSGITQPCVLATAALLTSAFRPEKMVLLQKKPMKRNEREDLLLVQLRPPLQTGQR
jgi:malonyl CoA-acyl carrier protein transacylase